MQNFDTVLGKNKADYSLYAFGACPAIAEVQAKFWEEEKALACLLYTSVLWTGNYLHQPMRAIFLARSFFISMLDWRAIMMRCACGEPAPCMDSGR